jgi:hypothetical protein
VVARPIVRFGARRRARRARRRLLDRVAEVARAEVTEPLAEARADHARFCGAVHRAGR